MAQNVTGNFTFCPPNVTLSQLWVEHGLSPCLVDTVVASSSLAFILVFGTIQSLFYRKYATEVQHYALPFSQLFGVQVTVNAAMPVIAIVRLLLEIYLFKEIYGHMALAAANYIIVWPFVIMMIIKERNFMLPTTPTKGHGLVLLIFWTGNFAYQNLMLINILNPDWFFKLKDSKDIWLFSLFVVQYVFSGVIFLLGLRAPGIPSIRHSDSFSRLSNEGDFTTDQMPESSSQGSAWSNMGKKIKMLLPFIWPRGSFWLQLNVIVCFVSLIGGRVTNVFVPIYSKYIVDSMTIETKNSSSVISLDSGMVSLFGADGKLVFRWDYVVILVALKVIQGGGAGTSGLLSNLRSLLWVRVSQYTTREVQVRFFGHLHNLGLRWHLSRKTGEVMRAMDRGTDSVNSILNYVLFSIFPTMVDIIVAIVYFTMFFNIWFGLIVFITMLVYLVATFVISEWRTKFRRVMNTADNLQKQRAVDSLLNFETVKYFANEDFEIERYEEAILKYQKEEWIVNTSLMILNMVQLFIINGGLLIGSLLCVKMVVSGNDLTVGDYVLFSSYLVQLYTPLNYFGTYYRMLQKCFIDMENMMDLFKEEEEVKDEPYAEDLQLSTGTIEFKNVSFSYLPQKSVLRDVSFVVPGGKTFAIVGSSGSGKTSLMRLLFRFYDVTSGSIFIDGQDIRTVTQVSLRKSIGVVPQDTVLFNDTIHYNIKYGDVNASDYQIIDAAKGAHIHDSILSFPERYDTVVGERGLKLSGGEKQRMAIARALLKKPAIILLDEATSALDTRTERQIQTSLYQLCEDRTSIIVAHRLSTVINADNIIVLSSEGTIAEQGKHDQLLAQNGLYSSMWNEQLKSDAAGGAFADTPKPEEE